MYGVFLLAALAPDIPLSYEEAREEGVRRNVPVVVYVGRKPYRVDSDNWIGVRADWLKDYGYADKTANLFVPQNGVMVYSRSFTEDEPLRISPVQEKPAFPDDLDEVNAKRAQRGLHALRRDPQLTLAAWRCAQFRAMHGIKGHTNNDFAFLEGGIATSAGCAALEVSWGWQSCCWDDARYTVAGASSVTVNGIRFTHIFVR